jgi:hypothetical protein
MRNSSASTKRNNIHKIIKLGEGRGVGGGGRGGGLFSSSSSENRIEGGGERHCYRDM